MNRLLKIYRAERFKEACRYVRDGLLIVAFFIVILLVLDAFAPPRMGIVWQ